MTAILRIVNVVVNDSSDIIVTFTESLTNNLVAANVSILSQTENVPDSQPLKLEVMGNLLSITCQPLTPYAAYNLQFQSVTNYPFASTNGDAKISEDGVSNVYLISGPLPSDNVSMDYFQSFYQNNIYRAQDPTTVVNQYLQSVAINFSRALYDIRQLKNENYISFNVLDELHTRGPGPFDRLGEEAAYDIFRVGLGPTNSLVTTAITFASFPSYPVTLQRKLATESIKVATNNNGATFNIDTLIFNLSNKPVTKVTSIIFTLNTVHPVYVYDIPKLGYQILDSTYDQDYASSYLLLQNNQIKINEAILQDPLFSLDQIYSISIQYEYKNLGIQVDATTLDVFTTSQAVREVLPPIINIFALQHAPITDSANNTPIVSGVVFTDPNSNAGAPHPAFVNEIVFSLSNLPSTPGVYAIDYPNATVYVFGADSKNDGTGPSPPLATYYYKLTYVSEIDYVYDEDLLEIVALPLGNLVNAAGTVSFKFEQVLVPGLDYTADSHIEAIDERIGNKIAALNVLTTKNSPITNVFRIYNETSGELYLLDRWNDNKVYFKYNSPPRIVQQTGEIATFQTVTNELLGINTTTTNLSSVTIFTINLVNNTIIASTQDSTASSINTSLSFTNGNVFASEIWYDTELDATSNINRLLVLGQYTVDYIHGIMYVAVSGTQTNDVGTASYKINSIVPSYTHVVSVDDIYYRISVLNPKNKQFSYLSFSDGAIVPTGLDVSDEVFLNGASASPYQLLNGQVGAFVDASFVTGVTNEIKFVRGVFSYNDLLNNISPINFASVSVSNLFNITVNSINKQAFESVQFDGSNYFINLNENIPNALVGITAAFKAVRLSDSYIFTTAFVPGNPVKLILTGGSPIVGDLVDITYSFTINSLERVVVDYNKGDFFVDYSAIADEILVSYEYGDNVLDFRQSTTVPENTNYYVSYKAGALRDALLKNFGTLVNVPDLSTFDLSLNRERYRDALQAALSSFIQGPTLAAIKNIGQTITHVEPQIIESAFEAWSLGSSLLFPEGISSTGKFQLIPAHFGNGALVNNEAQSITIPVNSNLRLEEGSFETWLLPQWHGLDNDADLTFIITRDGYAIEPFRVFIGGAEYHPVITNGAFTINKLANVTGTPNTNKDGVFIYYDDDPSKTFQRWYLEVIDGYVSENTHLYKFQIMSDGKFYDVKSLSTIKPANMTMFTGTNKVTLTIKQPVQDGYGIDGYGIDEGLTFISDLEHYILDFGLDEDASRLSIYKDVSGYLNFRVFDNKKQAYRISADVSSWQPNESHMVAVSWKLNTQNNRDEMHLFIDGLEVPNISRYGQKLQPYPHEHFRTIDPEEIIGLATRDIVGSTDLVITAGSPIVTSSINFAQYNISANDYIFIHEPGFNPLGYQIQTVSGQSLVLYATMPLTLANAKFSVNQTSYTITSDINVVPNIAVSTIHTFGTGSDLMTISGLPTVNSALANFTTLGVRPGFLIVFNGYPAFNILQVNGHSLTLSDPVPVSLGPISFQVYSNTENEIPGKRALNPSYSISLDANYNNILTIYNDVFKEDLILIRTLGLNYRDVDKRYYVWGDGYENVLMTQLPPPINLDAADITKIILPKTGTGFISDGYSIGDGYSFSYHTYSNATLVGGVFMSYDWITAQPTNSVAGRTIQATISGSNVDFTTPTLVTINGVNSASVTVNETLTFSDYGTQDFSNHFVSINYVQVDSKPKNINKSAAIVELKEKYPITYSEFSGLVPVVRFSYHIAGGYSLSANGSDNMVTDHSNIFSYLDVGNYLVIHYPAPAAGFYKIVSISADRHSIGIQSTVDSMLVPLPAFNGGIYQVLDTTAYRSGLQNGFFTLEKGNDPGTPYMLNHGFYEFEYSTYLSIKFDPLNDDLYLATDFQGNNTANAIIDHLTISSIMLSDTRIGEVVAANAYSVTKDFNSIKAPKSNPNTLVLIDFDTFPFTNSAGFYASTNNDHQHFQSDWAVNDNFGQSVVVLDKPIHVPNTGILDTRKQGTIEFWMSPLFDTGNDPNTRFYFDAYGAVVEEAISVSNVAVKISAAASRILSVTLAAGDPRIDYFVGGKLEIDTQKANQGEGAVQEDGVSIGTSSVIVSKNILQVITVKIEGDVTETDYFNNGSIGSDGKTIYLGTPLPQVGLPLIVTYQTTENYNSTLNTQVIRLNRRLPAQNSKVLVKYIPSGLQGDRVSIFKDQYGYINFAITASGTDFVIRGPTYWGQNTWHRVKAQYHINGGIGTDEMRLFLDGYEYTDVLFGQNIVVGQYPMVMGSVSIGDGYGLVSNITFKDPINGLWIGSDYAEAKPIFTLLDNFRISNVFRPIYAPFGESIDVNYSNNLSVVFPVTSDLYTTYLMDFDKLMALNTNFSTLVDKATGAFDFTVNIFDSFGIVSSSAHVQQILENLINILKPANTRVFIKYIQ